MISLSYKIYEGRYKLALIIIFAVITFHFGFFDNQSTSAVKKNYGTLLIYGNIILFILGIYLKLKLAFNFRYITLIYILLIWLFICMFLRDDMQISVNNYTNILLTQLFIIQLANIVWRIPFMKLLVWTLLFLHLILFACLCVHVMYVGKIVFGTHIPADRMGGLFFYGITGDLAGFAIVISLFLLYKTRYFFKRALYVLGCFLLIYYMLAADMRIALLAVSVAFVVQYVFDRLAQNKSILPIVFVSIICFIGFQLYVTYNAGGSNIDSDIDTREFIWGLALISIGKQTLIGYGDYGPVMRQLGESDRSVLLTNLHDPHSSYFSLILQSGIIAFIIFAILNVKVIKDVKNLSVGYKGVISFLAYWLICGVTGGNFFDFTYNIANVFFEFTLFGLILHPEIQKKYSIL
jgi:O-antigen ligase